MHATEGAKPALTLVFCPEKDLQLKKPDINEESKESTTTSVTDRAQIVIVAKDIIIEEEALKQLGTASKLKGCTHAFGMPDLHPGKGIPIGAAVIT